MPISITAPTFPTDANDEQLVHIKGMSSQDLALLKKTDPFSYFSIPAVRIAAMLNKDIEVNAFEADVAGAGDQSKPVKRQKRISVESHCNKLLEEDLTELFGNISEAQDDDEDEFYAFLSHHQRQNQGAANVSTAGVSDFSVPTFANDREHASTTANLPAIKRQLETSQSHVQRESRISFECHPDLLLEDLINEMVGHGGDVVEDNDPQEDLFLSFMESCDQQ